MGCQVRARGSTPIPHGAFWTVRESECPLSSWVWRPLTTFEVDHESVGAKAVMDGSHVIHTSVKEEGLSAADAVRA